MLTRLTVSLVAAITFVLGNPSSSPAETVEIAGPNTPAIVIVSSDQTDGHNVAQYLRGYLNARVERAASIVSAIDQRPARGVVVRLEVMRDQTTASNELQGVLASHDHRDAYVLEVSPAAGESRPVKINILGNSSSGLRSGVHRFIQIMANDGERLTLPVGRELHSPFINLRIICLAPSARRQMPIDSPMRDADFETWSHDRLRRYPELFAQFGFSGIQFTEIRGYGSIGGEDLKRVQTALPELARGAKELDMFVSLDQWGDCPYVEGQAFCWEVEKERKTLETFFEDLAQRYAKLADHLYIHVGDPGGATHGGCDLYATPQRLTAGAQGIFRRHNPDIVVTLSSWANTAFWKHCPEPVDLANYEPVFTPPTANLPFGQPIPEGAAFLGDAFMPTDIGIALHRFYNAEQAEHVLAADRPLDVWGWYTGDMEMMCNLTLNMSNIDKHYRRYPAEAGEQIRMQTIELCFHGWPQVINSYVGAQKMWDPERPLDEIEREFCVAGFGPQNAAAVHALYKACENPWSYSVWNTPHERIPSPPDLGTVEGNERMRRILKQAESIAFPKGWQSNFAFPVRVEKLVAMLKARLTLTLAYSEAMLDINEAWDEAQSEGIDNRAWQQRAEKIKQSAIANLPELPIDPMWSQGADRVVPTFRIPSWAEMISNLEPKKQ